MDILISYGYIGVFIASFLAATVLPFSSEVVLTGVLLAGGSYWPCMVAATLGNTLGGMTCYALGRLGKIEWIKSISDSTLHASNEFSIGLKAVDRGQPFLSSLPG